MKLWRQYLVLPLAAMFYLLIPIDSYASTDEITFDLSADSSSISVWIDLSYLLSNRSVELLNDGVEYVAEVSLELVRPRRLFGSKQITESFNHLHIKHHLITKEYQLDIIISKKAANTLRFTSLGSLHRFLADSVIFVLNHELDISSSRRYEVNLSITSILLTSFSLTSSGEKSAKSESALHYLFTEFLDFTGYGRETISTRSRSFRLSELSP